MPTHPTLNDVFCLLDKWRHFSAFLLEPRSEVLFALFLPTVLRECKSVGVKVKPQIIPQFPLKHDKSNQSDKVDFFALSEDGSRGFFIELKTDVNSRRRSQDDYLTEALDKTMCNILYDYREISKSKNDKHARQKYFHMSRALSELGLFKLEDDLEDTIYAKIRFTLIIPEVCTILSMRSRFSHRPRLRLSMYSPENPKMISGTTNVFTISTSKNSLTALKIRAIWAACSRAICENG